MLCLDKWPNNITHRGSVMFKDSNRAKAKTTNSKFIATTSIFHELRLCVSLNTSFRSCSNTVCAAWKYKHCNCYICINPQCCQLSPWVPWAGCHRAAWCRGTNRSRTGTKSCMHKGNVQVLQMPGSDIISFVRNVHLMTTLLFVFNVPSSRSTISYFCCSQLYVLRRFAALGLEGLLLAFKTFSVTLLRFLLSDPSLDPESDEVFSFSLLLGFSVVFPKLPEGVKTEIGSK